MKNTISKILLTIFSLLILACEKTEQSNNVYTSSELTVMVSDAGYALSPVSKAYEQYYYTEFETGDAIGIYVVENGSVICENQKFSLNALDEWIGDMSYMGGADYHSNGELKSDVVYYAYFPYNETISLDKVDASAATAADFFEEVIENWQVSENQSDYGYCLSDLMIATGYFENIFLGSHSLFFNFEHQMSMMHFEFPDQEISQQRVEIDGVDVFGYLQQLNQGAYLGSSNHYRYIINPYLGATHSVDVFYVDESGDAKQNYNTVTFSPSQYIYYIIDVNSLPSDGFQIADNSGTIGAFWRSDESGERIITIQPTDDDLGMWRAIVYKMDANWDSRDNIRLSNDMSNVDLSSTDAEQFQISETTQILYGFAYDSSVPIIFRVGLDENAPFDKVNNTTGEYCAARYATILLIYADGSKYQFIYLRQGEDADYLFRQGDEYNGTVRDYAREFSPYNLSVSEWGTADCVSLSVTDRATFVDYPSKMGAMFQWWRPYAWLPSGRSTTGWTTTANTAWWSTLSESVELAPENFRRVQDGATDAAVTTMDYTCSEFKQSLFVDPTTDYASNVIEGTYADGFYDRQGVSSLKDKASSGVLFYNENNFSSLFFPAGGTLLYTTGALVEGITNYPSSTAYNVTSPWFLAIDGASVYMGYSGYTANTGMPVRVVAETE
ncbi:MAG: fimbrillin family protein [Rikenellaceae bacterium]